MVKSNHINSQSHSILQNLALHPNLLTIFRHKFSTELFSFSLQDLFCLENTNPNSLNISRRKKCFYFIGTTILKRRFTGRWPYKCGQIQPWNSTFFFFLQFVWIAQERKCIYLYLYIYIYMSTEGCNMEGENGCSIWFFVDIPPK